MKSSLLYTPRDFFSELRDEAEVQNLLNTDIYKFLMLDFILAQKEYRDIPVKRKMTIRSKNVRTLDVIPKEALKAQLDATKSIVGVSEADLSYLRGMIRPDGKPLLKEETLSYLKNFTLGEYRLGENGKNYEIEFIGPWANSVLWEIYGLKIINSLYLSHYIKKSQLSTVEFNHIINETLTRLYRDVGIFQSEPGVNFSEFGTRRSASTDFQRMVFEILSSSLPGQCLGTSNVLLSREFGLANPRGTNAHELRMIPTALTDDSEEIVHTMYDIDRKWAQHFPGLSILLPDTYGTSYYFQHCPSDVFESHVGCRFDSKDPLIAIPEYVDFVLKNGGDPYTKIAIPSDGLTAKTAKEIYQAHAEKVGKVSFGIGTHLTNNTAHTYPRTIEPFGPFGSFSVVIKPESVQRPDGTWMSAVKLSDNPEKATGDRERIAFFLSIFGNAGAEKKEVLV